MATPQSTNWQVGTWTVLPNLNRINGNGESFRATPKALATLLCLAAHQGEVVTREMLFETVWAGTIVSDDTLNRVISDLRQIFGDTPQEPHVIETIRRRGYRLLLPAHPIASNAQTISVTTEKAQSFRSPQPHSWRGGQFLLVVSVSLLLGMFGFSLAQLNEKPTPASYRALPLTSSPGFEFDVAISFDGEQVAYIGSHEEYRQMDLFIKQIGVETPQQLTNTSRIEISPGWSPDGRAIAYLAGGEIYGECGLYVMKLPGGDEHKMADCKTFLVTGVSWSPDGKTIAFSDRASRDEPFRIYEVDVETRAVTQLTDPKEGLFGDFSATYSPDGKSVAFIRGTVANTTALILAPAIGDIHTLHLETGEQKRLTFDNQELPHIDWTPDGNHIVYASHRERGMPGLWKIDAKGGDPSWILGDNAFVRMPMMARKINRLVFEQWDNDVSIWQIERDAIADFKEQATPLISSTHFDATPQFSPDGEYLAFTSHRSGASEIWLSSADGTQPIQLTSFDGPSTSTPGWSPDGKQLAFETRTDGQSDIYTISVKGGKPHRLTHHALQDMVPSWSPDGKWIYFSSNRNGSWQVWKIPSEGGSASKVTTDGGFRALPSPTENHPMLYYTRIDKPGLYRQPFTGGSEELVLPDLFHDDWGNWITTQTGIYFLQREPSRLSFFDYQSEQITDLGRVRAIPIGMVGLSLSPDQKTFALVQQHHKNADLWMIDNFE